MSENTDACPAGGEARPGEDSYPSEAGLAGLVARAQGGDERAFGHIVQALRPRLELRVRLRLGQKLRDRVDPDDILQETFLEAYRLLPGFSWTRNGCLLRWLEAIAEHQVQRAVRRQKRREREVPLLRSSASSVTERTGTPGLLAQGSSPSQVAVRNETLERVEEALDLLPPDRREVVLLVHLYGMKAREAARRLGRSPQAVAVLLFRALRQLRALLKLPSRSSAVGGLPGLR